VPPSSTTPPAVGDIDHATGSTDVILRLEYGGGFVPFGYLATQAPRFTLFGNGVVVFQQKTTSSPEPDSSGVLKGLPWRTASLDEGQVQDLLAYALGPGGLGIAREIYPSTGIADAGDTIFTIRAGGVDKIVTINALGIDVQPGPDTIARAAFARLASRLDDVDEGGTIGADIYQPDRFRGILTERDPAVSGVLDWPWPVIHPWDFVAANVGTTGPPVPHRTMSLDEVAMLKLTDIAGGVSGLVLHGPDDKTYSLVLRPLLGDEQE
jgi:hypothetical protein